MFRLSGRERIDAENIIINLIFFCRSCHHVLMTTTFIIYNEDFPAVHNNGKRSKKAGRVGRVINVSERDWKEDRKEDRMGERDRKRE